MNPTIEAAQAAYDAALAKLEGIFAAYKAQDAVVTDLRAKLIKEKLTLEFEKGVDK